MNNKTIGIIVVVIVLAGGAYLLWNRTPSTYEANTTNTTPATQQQNAPQPKTSSAVIPQGKGRVVFAVTDATADMSAISEINLKVKSVELHSDASGWATVSTTPRTYGLLLLNSENQSELLADINAKPGTYNQVRLMVDSVSVKLKSGETRAAKLPSGTLKINTVLTVDDGKTSSVNFDFMADRSMHLAGNGTYIFAPVVKTETKNEVEVSTDANNVVTVAGGHLTDTSNVGMDIDGSVKVDFLINGDTKLNIDSKGVIKI